MAFAGEQTDPSQGDDQVQSTDGASDSQADANEVDGGENPQATITPEQEKAVVKKLWKEYERARQFDENYRKQIAIDRRYAAGTSDNSWAVTTNVIGAFIDILTSLLYARNPDVSVSKAPAVDETGTKDMEDFAKTLQIVISYLWKKGKLKIKVRQGVRSVLSVAEGWLKCTFIAEKTPKPEVETALNDMRETYAILEAQNKILQDAQFLDSDTVEAEKAEKKALMEELEDKLELAINKMFVIDFVRAEQMQVSTDVDNIEDYLDANWVANEIYVERDDALARFPRLKVEDLKSAKKYYQSKPKEMTTRDLDNVLPQGQLTAADAEGYTTASSDPESCALYRVVEIWDRRDKHIRTILEGVKRFAKVPYTPAYPTSRFYPYFGFWFYLVDGARHPQSLSWRLYKLQDEYSCTRSNFRLSRERAIPATMFDATGMDDTEARKLEEAKHQEYIAIRPTNPGQPIGNFFAPKPTSAIDPRLYDVSPINADMERISGVQEALQSTGSVGTPKTATEAGIEQSGTNARTTSDRDAIEWMLTDLAEYTAQQALQCLSIKNVQRMAGPKAYWPAGMDIEDLFTLVEVQIEAGTTGKPKQQQDQAAWGVILPLLEKVIGVIDQARASGNEPLADAMSELVKETMLRMGDTSDPTRFLPQAPPPGSPGAGAPRMPPPPDVKIALTGQLTPQTAAALAAPTVALDVSTAQTIAGAGGGPGGAPGAGAPPPGGGAPGQPSPGGSPTGATPPIAGPGGGPTH
jgi:hypothetical protein